MGSNININICVEVPDQLCADIMCTALEGGIGYWSQADKIERKPCDPANPSEDFNYVSCLLAELNDDEGGYDWDCPHILDYGSIRDGLHTLLTGYCQINSELRGYLLDAVLNGDASSIDSEGADAIVQAALFGEIKYG